MLRDFSVSFVSYHIAKSLHRTQMKEERGQSLNELSEKLFPNILHPTLHN